MQDSQILSNKRYANLIQRFVREIRGAETLIRGKEKLRENEMPKEMKEGPSKVTMQEEYCPLIGP